MGDFEAVRLGRGASGRVTLAVDRFSNSNVAIKTQDASSDVAAAEASPRRDRLALGKSWAPRPGLGKGLIRPGKD